MSDRVTALLNVFKELPADARSKEMCAKLTKFRKQTEKMLDDVAKQIASLSHDTSSESASLDESPPAS